MQINNEILYDFIQCQYKAYEKNKQQIGIISDYQILCNQLKQTQKINFEKILSENIKQIFPKITLDSAIPKEGIALNLNFTTEKIDLTVDGIEFTGKKNIIPIFITPFEKVTKSDKFFVALQAEIKKAIKFKVNLELNRFLKICFDLEGLFQWPRVIPGLFL